MLCVLMEGEEKKNQVYQVRNVWREEHKILLLGCVFI